MILFGAFALADPDNVCVVNRGLLASQFTNGLVMGTIHGLMAMGLTLIFSILRVVNFAHGEFYMVGGMAVFFFSDVWLPSAPPVVAVLAACAITFAIGGLFERSFLTLDHLRNEYGRALSGGQQKLLELGRLLMLDTHTA